jgi:hypothetical protein
MHTANLTTPRLPSGVGIVAILRKDFAQLRREVGRVRKQVAVQGAALRQHGRLLRDNALVRKQLLLRLRQIEARAGGAA